MTNYFPFALIALVIVMRFTFSSNKKRREFNQERRDSLNQLRKEYLSSLLTKGD